MKKIFLILSVLFSTLVLSNELSWVDKQVDAIKPPRIGMKVSNIKNLKDPFIFLEKNRTDELLISKSSQPKAEIKQNSKTVNKQKIKTVSKVLVLNVIMNNSAMISGEWYKLGDRVNGFEISEINSNSVLLHKQQKKLLLSTKSNTNKLKFHHK
ncbi:hypothetical protein MNB_SM-4-354 [hydrothermal vent metagenome]|uniref:Uncharacterized protein n=1 Tax=hydrothermal vent metagenome TaxID=652676 RepID=A0A1W1CDF0_9ZZZZ